MKGSTTKIQKQVSHWGCSNQTLTIATAHISSILYVTFNIFLEVILHEGRVFFLTILSIAVYPWSLNNAWNTVGAQGVFAERRNLLNICGKGWEW